MVFSPMGIRTFCVCLLLCCGGVTAMSQAMLVKDGNYNVRLRIDGNVVKK